MTIEINKLGFAYPEAGFDLKLDHLVLADRLTAFIGQNGAGKSTLLKLLSGLLDLQEGQVTVDGEDLGQYLAQDRIKKVGYTFQDPNDQIFNATVAKEVAWGLKKLGLPEAAVKAKTDQALKAVGLEGSQEKNPYDLSLSEKKLLTIATVLAIDPEIYLFDEPMMSLDYPSRQRVTRIFKQLEARGRQLIVITHDMDWLASQCERVNVMNHGRLIFSGAVSDLFAQPDLVEKIGVLPPRVYSLSQMLGIDPPFLSLKQAEDR